MSIELIKIYKQEVPAFRFIGKKGTDWSAWWQNGWFGILEKNVDENFKKAYEDYYCYLGLMRNKKGEPFNYLVGMLLPEKTAVPEGFEYHDFPKGTLGVCWVYGKENEVHGHGDECKKRLEEQGHKILYDIDGAYWYFERDGCPRFTTPDEKGNVITDVCYFVEG
jgi:predicted transcriptional regulator YdeE